MQSIKKILIGIAFSPNLKPNIFEQYPEGANFDLAEIYESLSDSGQLACFEAKNRFYEIGSHDGLKELNQLIKHKKEVK